MARIARPFVDRPRVWYFRRYVTRVTGARLPEEVSETFLPLKGCLSPFRSLISVFVLLPLIISAALIRLSF